LGDSGIGGARLVGAAAAAMAAAAAAAAAAAPATAAAQVTMCEHTQTHVGASGVLAATLLVLISLIFVPLSGAGKVLPFMEEVRALPAGWCLPAG
jgi:hypothetical protein